ncbi:MAG: bifunctional homocysteine S-methyltransferase/methylenetetrahydrofolate reductase [Eubacteriales bacterium]
MKVKEYIDDNILLFDGAMGTYFSTVYENPLYKCEYANITSPNTIKEIHKRYLQAGAKAIKTNTFSVYSESVEEQEFSYQQIIRSGFQIAQNIAKEYDAFVFCDIGPIQVTHTINLLEIYKKIVDEFIHCGGENFLFETFFDDTDLNEIVEYIKEKVADAFVLVSFAVNPDGYTKSGEYGRGFIKKASDKIDGIGFNCVCGPHHMNHHILETRDLKTPRIIMPNASYPTIIGNRVSYENNPRYFAKQMIQNVKDGARIIGGCCGTTPNFIKEIQSELVRGKLLSGENRKDNSNFQIEEQQNTSIMSNAFYEKLTSNKKPIAVELDSPKVAYVGEFMQGAMNLRDAGADLITIADCPIARARMDSSLLACKVKRELSVNTMPHMTCRDRNINASKALLLGLNVEEINNVLIVTGDPIPSEQRSEVKSVYEFNSRMLIQHISNLNQTLFESPFYLYAALNINARNFEVQLRLAKQKIENGAMAFFTQPVLSEKALENIRIAKRELGVPIIGGILPIVSERNAIFINNEIPGIIVSDEIIEQYKGTTKEESTQLAIEISVEISRKMEPYIDGYYIITPFKRVDIITAIIKTIKES